MWLTLLMRRRTIARSSVFCLVIVGTVAAGNVASAAVSEAGLSVSSRTISLHEAVVKTMEHNPQLRALTYQLEAQQGRVQQAGLAPSPELNFQVEDFLGTGQKKGVDNAQATLSVSWVLERGVRQHYIDAAHSAASLMSAETDVKRLEAAAETARLYLVSLASQARIVNADKTVQLAMEIVQLVSKRVNAGRTPEAELSRAQAELARRKLQREDIDHELRSANRRLAAQWGETALTFSRVEGDITDVPQVESFETLESQLSKNPEFLRLLSDQRLRQTELQLALAQEKPSWRVNAGVRHFNDSSDQALVAGFSIPFGERTRNPGRIAEARANLARTGVEEQAVRVRIETALFVIYENLQHGLHVIGAVRSDIIPPLEQALTETRRAYRLGRYSYLELRSVQEELLDAHNALIEAGLSVHRNIIEIERLTGVHIAQPANALKQTSP